MFVLALRAIVVDGSGSERREEGIGVHDEKRLLESLPYKDM